MIPALLHTCALVIALFVQFMNSPLAGAWLFFHLAAIGVMLRDGYPKRNAVWYCAAAWVLALGISTFFFAPVIGGAAVFFILSAMPVMCIAMHPKYIPHYIGCFGTVLAVFAGGLVIQEFFGVQYTVLNYTGKAWPLVDPNNAALVVNCGLIPAYWMTLNNRKWRPLLLLFCGGLMATHSIAGAGAALMACSILTAVRYGWPAFVMVWCVAGLLFIWLASFNPRAIEYAFYSLGKRYPIWEAAWALTGVAPLTGFGLGTFGYYYQQVRIEHETAGWYAHNDLLQFAVEMGWPGALCFVALAISVAITVQRRNAVAACVLLAGLLQSMVEFQYYLPSVCLIMGLALAFHSRNAPRGEIW